MEDELKLLPFAALAAVVALGACSGVNTVFAEYGGIKPVSFAHDGRNYRVYDKPSANRMMITPSLTASAGYYMRQSTWFGPELEFADAAQAFVAPRNCQVTNARVLVHPQFEVTYSCP